MKTEHGALVGDVSCGVEVHAYAPYSVVLADGGAPAVL
jgi:hypothetical protein